MGRNHRVILHISYRASRLETKINIKTAAIRYVLIFESRADAKALSVNRPLPLPPHLVLESILYHPVAKMATAFPSHPNLILSPVEQSGPRGYIRALYLFDVAEDVDDLKLFQALQESLKLTKEAVPLISAELVPDSTSEQKGRFALRQGNVGKLNEKNMRDTYQSTYVELREKNFPTSALSADLFCPVSVFPPPGNPVPAFHAQATLIKGGLVLSICVFHLCADARAIYEIYKIWAQNFVHLQSGSPACTSVPVGVFDKGSFVEPSQADSPSEQGGSKESHPEYVLFDQPPPPPPALLKTDVSTEVFHISPRKLRDLKADVSANLPDNVRISTNDAVTALVWHGVLAAQVDPETVEPGQRSLHTMCVDGRSFCSPPLPKEHIGCPMVYASPSIDVKTKFTLKDVSKTALAIRKAVNSIDAQYINSLVSWLKTIPSYECLGPASFGGLMGSSVMTTSWFKIPFYDVSWGPLLGNHCEGIRTAKEGFFNGAQCIMPEAPESHGGGMDVIIGLDVAGWEKFRQDDELWSEYAKST